MELINLKTMCEQLNISRRSIQCYENAGLMAPTARNKYGYLLYDDSAYHRAEKIKFLQRLGFKLREIKEIIDAPDCRMKEVLQVRIDELEKEKSNLSRIIQEAKAYIDSLD